MKSNLVSAALDKAFAPDVSLTLDADFAVTKIETRTSNGLVWYNQARKRFPYRKLVGLSVDTLTSQCAGVTFETIIAE